MEGFNSLLCSMPALLVTLDNGVENTRYQELRIPTYFCHPYHSWGKVCIEQGIGILREFLPKKADLKDYSESDMYAMVETINTTPMKCLSCQTPKEVFNEHTSLTLNPECCA